ncbi:DUF6310 domain-containing protein [Archangium sp.]|uniref:DUF6310 domain-containing protein n=1 Tax=Archangium sp. TaxID=1872627 RepID=UPI0039C89F8B
MRLRACIALLLFVSACATSAPSPEEPVARTRGSPTSRERRSYPGGTGGGASSKRLPPPRSQTFFVRMKMPEIQRERELAKACGYRFVVGVHSKAHKEALLMADNTLDVVVMDWC